MCTLFPSVLGAFDKRGALGRALVALAVSLLWILVVAAPASGQGGTDQYVPSANPPANTGGVAGALGKGGKVAPLDHTGTGGPAVATETSGGSSGGGELPFTGIPLTPFVWIAIALLAAGLLARLAARLTQQFKAARTGGP